MKLQHQFILAIVMTTATVRLNAQIITKIAGGFGEGLAATQTSIGEAKSVATDSKGNLYIAEWGTSLVRKIDMTKKITTIVAGDTNNVGNTGGAGYSGDGGLATHALLNEPTGVALDKSDNIFIADAQNNRVRKVDAKTGIITTIAGDGTLLNSGDGGKATNAKLSNPSDIAFDIAGNIYIACANAIRKITISTGIISTVAGGGSNLSDGVLATTAQLGCSGIAIDASNNIYIADQAYNNLRIREVVASTGIITTIAGGGSTYNTSITNNPLKITVDATGSKIYYTCSDNGIYQVIGAGYYQSWTNNSLFVSYKGIILSGTTLYFTDGSYVYNSVANINSINPITIAGNGPSLYSGDGGQATNAQIEYPVGVAVDKLGNVILSDNASAVIRKVNKANIISTIAGLGQFGTSGDGGQAINCTFTTPSALAFDNSNNLYIADNNYIRRIDNSTGIITTYAGSATKGSTYTGDGGLATNAGLYEPAGIVFDNSNNLYIADKYNHCIRKVVAKTNIISTIAGNGTQGYSGDGGLATIAQLNTPVGIAIDKIGNIYTSGSNCIRKVDAKTNIISTIAGNYNASPGYSGDGGLAINALLSQPYGLVLDKTRNFLYVSDQYNYVIRKIDLNTNIITTVAGNGIQGSTGNGGNAIDAELGLVNNIALDGAGNLLLSDGDNGEIRMVSNNSLPVTIEGFNAKILTEKSVLLSWKTANELNTSHLIIQHSTDGNSFTDIGTVKAIGSGANNYSFTDTHPANGINYYRLVSVDKDGANSFS